MKSINLIIILFSLAIFITSCSSTKKTGASSAIKSFKSPNELMVQINNSHALPERLSTKTNIQYKSEKENQSVTAQIRIRLDSAIWISVTPLLGIEVARVLITKDSVKYLDRFNKKYSAQSIIALKKYIPIEGDFYTLQSIILGNHFTYSKNIALKSVLTKNKYYVLSSLNKKELKNTVNKKVLFPINQQNVWVLPEIYRINKQVIIDNTLSHSIQISYDEFEETSFGWFPKKTKLLVSSDNKIEIYLRHSRIQNNKFKTLPFKVPASYESIN